MRDRRVQRTVGLGRVTHCFIRSFALIWFHLLDHDDDDDENADCDDDDNEINKFIDSIISPICDVG